MKYRRRSPVIDAVQWTGDMTPIIALIGHDLPTYGPPHSGALKVINSSEQYPCFLGDWIVLASNGQVYPIPADVFERIYEPAEASQ